MEIAETTHCHAPGDGRAWSSGTDVPSDARAWSTAVARGALLRCPACGGGGLFRAYLKPTDACPACGEELFHQRADDAPPYVTIFVVGHLIVAAAVGIDMAWGWPLWLHALVWLPATVALCLGLLPVAKGALIGLQWALRMHGFGGASDAIESHPVLARLGPENRA